MAIRLKPMSPECNPGQSSSLPKTENPSAQQISSLLSCLEQGRHQEAAALARSLTLRFPDNGIGWKILGAALELQSCHAEALPPLRQAAALLPLDAEAHCNLGACLKELGRFGEAELEFRKALEILPGLADAHNNLGATLIGMGRLKEAAASCRRALAIAPDFVAAYNNLGFVLHDQGGLGEAESSWRRALRLKPDLALAHYNLGVASAGRGCLEEAETGYRLALICKPNYLDAQFNLGNLLADMARLNEAERAFGNATKIKPGFAAALNNLSGILKNMGRPSEALARCHKALALEPDLPDAYGNLGSIQIDRCQPKDGLTAFRRALHIKPDFATAHSNLLLSLNYIADLPATEICAEHRLWDERQTAGCHPVVREDSDRNTGRRLRIGYVSPDFRRHSVAYFFEPLLRMHNRQEVEVFCYAEVARPDAVTFSLEGLADHWLRTVGMSDESLARRIADDRIDILVDLAGHTAHNRLLVFARKAAPIQVSWLGYPHSTGLRAMDYRLVDALTDPPGDASACTGETLVRLRDGFLCYAAAQDVPPPAPPPSLANGFITFGSFNNPSKLSPATFDVWAQLLNAIPASRLLLKGRQFSDAAVRTALLADMQGRGIDFGRITLAGREPDPAGHLSLYAQVDIALDPLHYNGTTTTCEALWMGVPVITLRGDRHAGRVGASLLTRLGLADLIAASPAGYVRIAADLAADQRRRIELRETLRARIAASPLCDATDFARRMEDAYREMWGSFCKRAGRNG